VDPNVVAGAVIESFALGASTPQSTGEQEGAVPLQVPSA
jgi:hypothetical protein